MDGSNRSLRAHGASDRETVGANDRAVRKTARSSYGTVSKLA